MKTLVGDVFNNSPHEYPTHNDSLDTDLLDVVSVIREAPGLVHLLVPGGVAAVVVAAHELLVVREGGDDALLPPGLAVLARAGHGVSPPVAGPGPVVAAVWLQQLPGAGDAEPHAVVAVHAAQGRQLLTLGEHELLEDGGVAAGRLQLGLAVVSLQDLALLAANLPRPLGPLVTKREGGMADGIKRKRKQCKTIN